MKHGDITYSVTVHVGSISDRYAFVLFLFTLTRFTSWYNVMLSCL